MHQGSRASGKKMGVSLTLGKSKMGGKIRGVLSSWEWADKWTGPRICKLGWVD